MTAEVVVVGGGPAGAAAAIALARHGVTPLVLDAARGPGGKVGECLPPLANPLLSVLGVVDRLGAGGHLRSHGVRSAWGSPELVERDFLFTRSGPGWHLDRTTFESELADAARAAGADWRAGARVTGVVRRNDRWAIAGDTPAGVFDLAADFVIDATGRRAVVARRLGAGRTYHDRLVGVEATLYSSDSDPPVGLFSLVEAVPSGWWYSAPLPDARLSVVYMTDADLPAAAAARTVGGWQSLLREAGHTSRRVAVVSHRGPPRLRAVTAATSRLLNCVGEGWVAVGDAAVTFDPLSSHGMYSALAGGYQAGRAVARALAGGPTDLREYSDAVDEAYRKYLAMRDDHYATERRWPEESFWLRRHRSRQLRAVFGAGGHAIRPGHPTPLDVDPLPTQTTERFG